MLQIVPRIHAQSDHASGHTHHDGVVRHRMDHYRARANFGMTADGNITQDRGACSNHHVVPDRRMPLALLLAGSAQCHSLIQQNVVADLGSLSDHYAHPVIDKTPPSDCCAWMYLNSRQQPVELRDDSGQQRKARIVKLVGAPVPKNGMEAWVTEKDLQRALGGGISAKNGLDLFPDGSKHASSL